ncbi:MAG: protein translocase subunit SecF [Bdellovibrionales bacterium]|nr:protein translocase subunit SecF [Bdellovibrionales bacterium]
MSQEVDRNSKSYREGWGRYDFLGVATYITALSVVLTILAGVIIGVKGLNYGVDFAGGIELQVQFKDAIKSEEVRSFLTTEGFAGANVQALGENHEYFIHLELETGKTDNETNAYIQETVEKIKRALSAKYGQAAEVRRVDTVGPQVGAELRRNGLLAGFYALLLIMIYVGLRFDYRFAPGAVFTLFHDAVITMGVYSLFGWEFTVQTMAAILTIIGYSLNDTVVIFDRIRENIPIYRGKDLYWISNKSINETLSRTLLTYFSTYLTVIAMLFMADGVIRDFARAMAIGMFLGCYSTVYVATPIMLMVDRYQRYRKSREIQTA